MVLVPIRNGTKPPCLAELFIQSVIFLSCLHALYMRSYSQAHLCVDAQTATTIYENLQFASSGASKQFTHAYTWLIL